MILENFVSGKHYGGGGLLGRQDLEGAQPLSTDFTSQLREWMSSGQDPSDYCSVSVFVVQPSVSLGSWEIILNHHLPHPRPQSQTVTNRQTDRHARTGAHARTRAYLQLGHQQIKVRVGKNGLRCN